MAEPHDVIWTAEKVERFWDDLNRRRPDFYFSAQVAPALADWIARKARPGRERVIDLGSGTGVLLEELVQRGYTPLGIDSSPESVRSTATRIGQANAMVGSITRIPVSDATASGVLLVETIEHILDEDLEPLMREVRRVLAPGAPLVITTPNSEDLESAKAICPDCGAAFHPMQHVRSWTPDGLAGFLRSQGFSHVQTFETRLAAGRGLRRFLREVMYRVRGDKDHLLAIARVNAPWRGGE